MLKGNLIKGIGLAATVVGMGATLLTDWVNERKMEEKIKEKVDEALAEREKELEEEQEDEEES